MNGGGTCRHTPSARAVTHVNAWHAVPRHKGRPGHGKEGGRADGVQVEELLHILHQEELPLRVGGLLDALPRVAHDGDEQVEQHDLCASVVESVHPA